MRRLAALVLAVLGLAVPASATTYYVAKTGSNSNTCVQAQSTATPKLTIAAGLACLAAAGDTLQIRTGTYAEQLLEVQIPVSGTSWAAPITIQAFPGETVTLRPVTGQGNVLRVQDASVTYVIFDHLVFDGITAGGGGGGSVVYFGVAANHLRVSNSEIANGDGNGVLGGGDFAEFLNDAIHTNGRATSYTNSNGMYMTSTNSIVVGGTIYDNECYGVRFYDSDPSLHGDNNTVRNARIYGNGNGRGLSGASVCGSGGGGIVLSDTNNVAMNNLVYNNYWGLQISTEKTPAVKWYNNTVTANDYGVDMTNRGSANSFINNIVYANINLQLYQMGSVVQSNNLTTNPQFVNAATFDFHLTAASTTAIDQGATIATVTTDFDGVTRPKGSAYDIGAYEYQPPVTPVLATARQGLWSTAGATITVRTTQCGPTLQPGVSNAQINTAIQNCGAGQVVQLGSGTFNLNGSLDFAGKSNVTLRGNGPTATQVVFNGTSLGCGGLYADVCVGPATNYDDIDNIQNSANWTAGYAKGATSVTLSTTANLQVGALLFLDQLDDSNTDNGSLWNCSALSACANEGGRSGRNSPGTRNQTEVQIVTSVPGGGAAGAVGISPGLEAPNWRSGQSPGAYWRSTLPITGVGIEGIGFDSTNNQVDAWGGRGTIVFRSATHSWASNVVTAKGKRAQILGYMSSNLTFKDSYLHTSRSLADQAYGVELFLNGHTLVQNNIVLDVVASLIPQGMGNVFAYNYIDFNTYNPSGAPFPPGNSQIQAGLYHHDGGTMYTLYEGNDANSMKADMVHGTANFITGFRNRLWGQEPLKTCHTTGVLVYAFNRFGNTIGNVIGTQGYHTSYNVDQTGCGGKAIYLLGPNTLGATDARVESTMMRWGNYDTVNAATRFLSAEVPSGLSDYPNPVPGNQTLPASLYRGASATAPTWWTTPWGSPSYPPIGPDVTGGTLAGVAGHAQKIPARLCYENLTHTTAGSTTGTIQLIANFDAASCYATTSVPTDTTPPVVTITTNGGANFTTTTPTLTTLAGGATDDVLVVFDCRWTNAANAGAGTAPGAFTWTVPSIPLALGPNLITVYCHDAANNEGNAPITVTLTAPPPSGPFYRLRIGG